jgi:hypothetical protein
LQSRVLQSILSPAILIHRDHPGFDAGQNLLTRYRAPVIPTSVFFVTALWFEGCQRTKATGEGINDSTFVAVVADLRLAVMPGGVAGSRDSAGQAAARDSILRKYRVTPAALESVASRLANRPKHAADIFGAIDRKVLSTPVPGVPRTVVPGAQPAVVGRAAVAPGSTRPGQPLLIPPSPASANPTPTRVSRPPTSTQALTPAQKAQPRKPKDSL